MYCSSEGSFNKVMACVALIRHEARMEIRAVVAEIDVADSGREVQEALEEAKAYLLDTIDSIRY